MSSHPRYHFLLVFDHRAGHLKDQPRRFESQEKALQSYAATEREYADTPSIEVVVVSSDSLAEVERTHANYFDGTDGLDQFLADKHLVA